MLSAPPPCSPAPPEFAVPSELWDLGSAAASPALGARPGTVRSRPALSPRACDQPIDGGPRGVRHGCSDAPECHEDDLLPNHADGSAACREALQADRCRPIVCERRSGEAVQLCSSCEPPPLRNLLEDVRNGREPCATPIPCRGVSHPSRARHGVCMKVRKVRNPYLGCTFWKDYISAPPNTLFFAREGRGMGFAGFADLSISAVFGHDPSHRFRTQSIATFASILQRGTGIRRVLVGHAAGRQCASPGSWCHGICL